jgi:excisionase family DNA binding protein
MKKHKTESRDRNPGSNRDQNRSARPLMDVAEAADMLCVSKRYIRVLQQRDDLPVVRLGRRTLVRRADVDAIVARGGLADRAR